MKKGKDGDYKLFLVIGGEIKEKEQDSDRTLIINRIISVTHELYSLLPPLHRKREKDRREGKEKLNCQ